MDELDRLDQVAGFDPFYDEEATKRLLDTYYQVPHTFDDNLKTQLFDHAAFYNIPLEQQQVQKPEDDDFNLLRGIKQMGQGFVSGFTTFNVGEPTNNEYERIMRSIGSLGGFLGYVPAAPLKAMKAFQLANMARALKGNSVPLYISRKATEQAGKVASGILDTAKTAKAGAFKDVATFLSKDQAKHVAEGAFNLGVASGVGSWQYGINEALKSVAYGATTGGVFRGLSNMINKGGIPKLDQATGRYVYTASQNEDRILRAAASSLYDGLQSTMRGETTPEQIYSYLLGAYFGANETTAGQDRAMKFVNKVEKQAQTSAKELKRLNPDDGKAFTKDALVYDPRLVDGYNDLPKDVQESVVHTIAMRHGTLGAQAAMAGKTLEGIQDAIELDIANVLIDDSVRKTQIENEAVKGNVRTLDKVDAETIRRNKEEIFLTETDSQWIKTKKGLKPLSGPKLQDNELKLPLGGMQDEDLRINKKLINDSLKQLEDDSRTVAIDKNLLLDFDNRAPETSKHLRQQIVKLQLNKDKAEQRLEAADKIKSRADVDHDPDATGDTEFELSEITIEKKSNAFVDRYLSDLWQKDDAPDVIGGIRKDASKKVRKILNDNVVLDDYEGFIKKVKEEPSFDTVFGKKEIGEEAQGELRQLFLRQVQQVKSPHLSIQIHGQGGGNRGIQLVGMNKAGKNAANNIKSIGESEKLIESVYKKLYKEETGKDFNDRSLAVIDHVVKQVNGRKQEIALKDLGNKKWWSGTTASKPKYIKDAVNRTIGSALRQADDAGYYYNGGKGDTGKMYLYKYHPAIDKLTNNDISKKIAKTKELFKKSDPDAADAYEELKKNFVSKYVTTTRGKNEFKSFGTKKELEDYFDKSFLSNIEYDKALYGIDESNLIDLVKDPKTGKTKEVPITFEEWLANNSSIRDAKGFNKRNQIWLTDGFELDNNYFKSEYKRMGGRIPIENDQLKFRLYEDSEVDGLTSNDPALLYTEASDGQILIEKSVLDAINKAYGHPYSGQNKAFLVDNDPKHGALLGKMMFHKASDKASKWMRDNNIHMLVPKSAAKEFGSRKIGNLKVNDDLTVDYKGGEDYGMNISAIKGSLSEKQTQHMLDPQKIPKQLMSNLIPHSWSEIDQGTIDNFFKDIIGEKHLGETEWNNKVLETLDSEVIDPRDEADILRNLDKVGLDVVVDAIKNNNHPQFVAKLYQKILHSNTDNLKLQYEEGEIESPEFREAMAEAKNYTSVINRMMTVYPDLAIFLHKDVRNYLQAAMRNFVVNRVIRPKWDYSVSVRMRGYDPWIAKELPDMGMDMTPGRKGIVKDRAYLKSEYGVENPDQLFYLDNAYADVEYDVSDLFVGAKKNKKMKLKDIWAQRDKPKVKEFFKTISLRVPMDSISGAHELAFAGFTGIDGHGAIFHPRTMRALGGADLDGDKAFVMFGMKKEYRDMYHKNKDEFKDPDTLITQDNKTANISLVGKSILADMLNPKDTHDARILDLIAKNQPISYRDLFTLTNDGGNNDSYKSFISKYTPEARMDISNKAVTGRDQLGPAVVAKQILNASYDAIKNNPVQRYVNKDGKILTRAQYDGLSKTGKKLWKEDNRESLIFKLYGDDNEYEIFLEPRTSKEELAFSREVSRAQIAFGSDPLDELGLTGANHFYDTLFHSLFKIDWNGNEGIKTQFSPTFNAKGGTIGTFRNFNRGYFSRNFDQNRRFYNHEIKEFADKIQFLEDNQKGNMLSKMVEVLQPLDYSDDIAGRIDPEKLKDRYAAHEKLAVELKAINDAFERTDKKTQKKIRGLLGRTSFRSIQSTVSQKVMGQELYRLSKRQELSENETMYRDFFKDLGGRWDSNYFKAHSFPWEHTSYFNKKGTKELDHVKYDRAVDNVWNFRSDSVSKVYRQGTDFIQNDAMDRASAIQLMKAINMARKAGVSDEFINVAANFVQGIKNTASAQRQASIVKSFEKEGVMDDQGNDTRSIMKVDGNNKARVINLFTEPNKEVDFQNKEIIDARIEAFKQRNKWQMADGKTRALGYEESFLVDTLLLSSYHKGKDLSKLDDYQKLPPSMKDIVDPLIKEIKLGGSATLFEKTGLNSSWVNDTAVAEFLREYSKQFDYKENVKFSDDIDYNKALNEDTKSPELEKIAPSDVFEKDYEGIIEVRDRLKDMGKVKLSDFERKMVDKLIGHLNYYHNSLGNTRSLNQIVRGLTRKNFDAMGVEDYRVVNQFFDDLRAGTVFTKAGALTKDNIVKLAKRHWMLFPKTVSREMMVKDFEIFTQQGRFQNYKGEWVRGNVGRPTHTIENIQFVLGKVEALAIKMDEEESSKLDELLKAETGYESIPDNMGQLFSQIATARKDLRNFLDTNSNKAPNYHVNKKIYEQNLKEAEELADFSNTKSKVYAVKTASGTWKRNGEKVVQSIDNTITNRAIETYGWVAGKHYKYDPAIGKHVRDLSVADPLDQFVRYKDKKKTKVDYWFGNESLPKIKADEFRSYIMDIMKKGDLLDMGIGLDNLRKISRSIQIEQVYKLRDLSTDAKQKSLYNELAKNLGKAKYGRTGQFKAKNYHPHFIQNKAVAQNAMEAAIKEINKKTGIADEIREKEIARVILRYKSMTGDWIVNDVAESNMLDGAYREIAERRKGQHLKQLESDPISGNMMSRSIHLPGWNRDIGSWDIYQKNLIDTFYRQIGQIISKQMLNDFNDRASQTWKNPEQVKAWNSYIYDYITRAMGFPSKLPEQWMDGPEADIMKVKGTPYSWFADNHVKDMINRIRGKFGFKDDPKLPDEIKGVDEMDIRHWSNLEAKYQMATLLAHPKSAAGNIFGGTVHTIQSTGWRNFLNARSVEHWRTHIGNEASKWKSKEDIERWAISHGVVPNFVLYEAGLNPNFKSGKYKRFLKDAELLLKKDPMVKDESLISLAKKHQISEAIFQKAAWFMRRPERALRRDAFAAHYLQARELYGHSNMGLNDPLLIEMAKKGVQATQFLYSAPYRPAFSATALGKVMTRFQTWAWNSVRFRNDIYREAKLYGFRRGTQEFERFKRQTITDMFVLGMSNVFAYSLFETAMPQPYSWFQDTADWIFGNEEERDRAFFGNWPTAVAPLQMVTPPGLRLAPALFNSMLTNDYSRLTDYYIMTMFPFGRIARDFKGVVQNPFYTIEKATGIPYIQMSREIKKDLDDEDNLIS